MLSANSVSSVLKSRRGSERPDAYGNTAESGTISSSRFMSSHWCTKLLASVTRPLDRRASACTCRSSTARLFQLAVDGQLQQLVVGNRIPEEERQPGRELDVADGVAVARAQAGRHPLAAVEEERAGEQAGDGAADAAFEAAFLDAVLVVQEQLVDVLGGHRTAVGAPRERRDDLSGAARLRVGCRASRRVADEDALPARRRRSAPWR